MKKITLYLTAIELEKLNYRFNSYCPLIFAYQYGNQFIIYSKIDYIF